MRDRAPGTPTEENQLFQYHRILYSKYVCKITFCGKLCLIRISTSWGQKRFLCLPPKHRSLLQSTPALSITWEHQRNKTLVAPFLDQRLWFEQVACTVAQPHSTYLKASARGEIFASRPRLPILGRAEETAVRPTICASYIIRQGPGGPNSLGLKLFVVRSGLDSISSGAQYYGRSAWQFSRRGA